MAFDEKLKKRVRAKVIKKRRNASEIGAPIGYKGAGIGRVLAELVSDGDIVKHEDTRPATYTKV